MHRFVVESMRKTLLYVPRKYPLPYSHRNDIYNSTFGASVPGRKQWAAFDNAL